MDDSDIRAIMASDPDPVALIDVLELIAPDALVHGWHHLAGGLGTAMHRIDVGMPSGAETHFVLRRYLPEVGDDSAVALREALTLEALRATPVPAPDMLWADPDGAVFGRPALAMTLLPGHTHLADAAPDAWTTALAEALVTLQWTPATLVPHLPRLSDPVALRDWYLDRPLQPSDLADVDALRAALQRAPDVEPVAPTLLHGDFHAGNVLRDDGRITGVVDWSRAIVGDPRYDAVYCAFDLTLFAGPEVADAFLAAYEHLRGPIVDRWFFALLAAAGALPDPMDWAPSYEAHGVTIDADDLRQRFTAWVDRALADVTPEA